jgi:hypothetical protein
MCIFGANFIGAGLNMLIRVALGGPFNNKPEEIALQKRFVHTAITHLAYALGFAIAMMLRVLALGGALS